MGVVTYEILCEHCGTEFEARSTKRKYCSGNCRTAAHRYQKIQASESSKGDKLSLLMDESEKICKEFDVAMRLYEANKVDKNAWERVKAIHQRSMANTREIAKLLAN